MKSDLEKVDCKFDSHYDVNYKVLYFKETDEFMLKSKTDLVITIVSNINKNVRKCRQHFDNMQYNNINIIYTIKSIYLINFLIFLHKPKRATAIN